MFALPKCIFKEKVARLTIELLPHHPSFLFVPGAPARLELASRSFTRVRKWNDTLCCFLDIYTLGDPILK